MATNSDETTTNDLKASSDVKTPKQDKAQTTERDLTNFKVTYLSPIKNLKFVTLDEANAMNKPPSRYGFISTGTKPDSSNNGAVFHWICFGDNFLFDSYGNIEKMKLPDYLKTFNDSQIQAFGSSVCGEYCCSFLYFLLYFNGEKSLENYLKYFALGKSTSQNDRTILRWYKDPKEFEYNE